MYLRGLVAFGLLLDQLSLRVDCEDPTHWNSHLLIGKHILCGDKTVDLWFKCEQIEMVATEIQNTGLATLPQ